MFGGAVAFCSCFAATGLVGHIEQGFPGRFNAQVANLRQPNGYHTRTCFLMKDQTAKTWEARRCTFGSDGSDQSIKVLLWGDSHAAHLVPGLSELGEREGFSLVEATFAGCPPVLGYQEYDNPNCAGFNERVASYVRDARPNAILLSARWNAFRNPYYLRQLLESTIRSVRLTGASVGLVGESPSFAAPVPEISFWLRHRGLPSTRFPASESFRDDETLRALSVKLGVPFTSPRRELCDDRDCSIEEDGALLFWDESHLTEFGSLYLVRQMSDFVHATLGGAARDKVSLNPT